MKKKLLTKKPKEIIKKEGGENKYNKIKSKGSFEKKYIIKSNLKEN
jgi:hypothetical protein